MQTTWSCDCKHLCPTMHANDAEFSDMRSFNALKTQYNESIRNYVPVLQSYQLRQLNWLSRIQHKADSKWCAEITKIYKYTIQSVVSVHTLRLLDKTKYKKSFKAALCNCVCGSLSKTSISIQKLDSSVHTSPRWIGKFGTVRTIFVISKGGTQEHNETNHAKHIVVRTSLSNVASRRRFPELIMNSLTASALGCGACSSGA